MNTYISIIHDIRVYHIDYEQHKSNKDERLSAKVPMLLLYVF